MRLFVFVVAVTVVVVVVLRVWRNVYNSRRFWCAHEVPVSNPGSENLLGFPLRGNFLKLTVTSSHNRSPTRSILVLSK